MKNKITQFIPAVLALAAVGFSRFSFWCTSSGHFCYRTWLDSIFIDIINPLYFFALFLLPIVIILIFIPRHIFNSWLKFAAWALPLSFIYIAMTPVWDSSWLPFTRDDAARLAGEVFSGASLILIIYRALRSAPTK